MEEGLTVDQNQFMCLPQKKQMAVLYKNQVVTLELLKGYKFTQKVQYVLLSAALAGLGILFKMHIGM